MLSASTRKYALFHSIMPLTESNLSASSDPIGYSRVHSEYVSDDSAYPWKPAEPSNGFDRVQPKRAAPWMINVLAWFLPCLVIDRHNFVLLPLQEGEWLCEAFFLGRLSRETQAKQAQALRH